MIGCLACSFTYTIIQHDCSFQHTQPITGGYNALLLFEKKNKIKIIKTARRPTAKP